MGGIDMKAVDLMIGDWVGRVFDDKRIIEDYRQVDWIRTGEIGMRYQKVWSIGCIEPILLTHEILEKNGWKETQYWHEYQDGKNTIQCCPPELRGKINGIEIEHFKCEYVHQYQHLLRLCGLDELADNFKI